MNTTLLYLFGIHLQVLTVTGIVLDTALISLSPIGLDVVAGAATVSLDTSYLSLFATDLSVLVGATSVGLDTAYISIIYPDITVTVGAIPPTMIGMGVAIITITKIMLDVIPGSRLITFDTA